MKNLHAKSPCCRGGVIRFGKRRRQCIQCRHTWRIRLKKRGRKKGSASPFLIGKYINKEIPSCYTLAKIKPRKSKDWLERRLRRSLARFINTIPWPAPPTKQPCIAVADAMMIIIDKQLYTFYFILVRAVSGYLATIMEPYSKEGKESLDGWHEAFNRLPEDVRQSICALTSDGHYGLTSYARINGWHTQLCHFHIIAKLQGRRSQWARSRHRALGKRLYFLVKEIITNPDEYVIIPYLHEIDLIRCQTSSRQLRTYLSGFIKRYRDYRTHLKYPELNLPRTSNSAEALIGSIRNLCYRARGFRTIHSLSLWIQAILKHKKTVTCNGHLPTKLMR